MSSHNALAIASSGPASPSRPLEGGSVVVSEFRLNAHETFTAEIADRHGKSIVAIQRWRRTPGGLRRAGPPLEFAGHRAAGIGKIIADVVAVLAPHKIDGGAK